MLVDANGHVNFQTVIYIIKQFNVNTIMYNNINVGTDTIPMWLLVEHCNDYLFKMAQPLVQFFMRRQRDRSKVDGLKHPGGWEDSIKCICISKAAYSLRCQYMDLHIQNTESLSSFKMKY